MLNKLRRLAEVCPSEWLVLSVFFLFALTARLSLRFMSLSRVTVLADRLKRLSPWTGRIGEERLVFLADLAARTARGRKRCLDRSLLLYWLLKARGEQANLWVGVTGGGVVVTGVVTGGGVSKSGVSVSVPPRASASDSGGA